MTLLSCLSTTKKAISGRFYFELIFVLVFKYDQNASIKSHTYFHKPMAFQICQAACQLRW